MDQKHFNQVLSQSSSMLSLSSIKLLDEEKMRSFAECHNDLINPENYILLLSMVSLGIIEITGSEGEMLLCKVIALANSMPCEEEPIFAQVLETLLMYSDGNFSPVIFNGAHSYAKAVGLKYYANRCKLLEAQISSASRLSELEFQKGIPSEQ
jgi:hypothetical protein